MADETPVPTPAPEAPAPAHATETPKPAEGTAAAAPPAPAADPMAAKFAALARKDKESRAREAALAEKEAAIAARVKKAEAIEAALAAKDENPLAVFDALGVDIEKFADKLIEGPPKKKDPTSTAVEQLQKQIEELRAERAKEAAERQAAAQAAAVQKYQQEIADEIGKAADKYELINEKKAAALVYAVIEQNYEQTKELMSIAEAADMVEKSLEAEVANEAKFFATSKAKKVQAALQAAGFTAAEAKKIAAEATAAPTAAAAAVAVEDDTPLTAEDWVKVADETGKKSMVLTNDVVASLPNYRVVKDEGSDFQKALELLQFTK